VDRQPDRDASADQEGGDRCEERSEESGAAVSERMLGIGGTLPATQRYEQRQLIDRVGSGMDRLRQQRARSGYQSRAELRGADHQVRGERNCDASCARRAAAGATRRRRMARLDLSSQTGGDVIASRSGRACAHQRASASASRLRAVETRARAAVAIRRPQAPRASERPWPSPTRRCPPVKRR
jgi:hypothetical protein